MLTMLVILYFSKKQQTFTHLNTSTNNIIFRCAITAYYSGAVLGAWPLWLMYLLITAATLIWLICSWSEILPCLFQSLLSLTIRFSLYGNSLPCSASVIQVDMAYRSRTEKAWLFLTYYQIRYITFCFSDHSDPFHAQNCQYIYSSKSFI